MRTAARISQTPGEYHDAQELERRRILAELLELLRRARADREPWYEWLRARAEGRHVHDLTGDDGRPVACPVGGCTAVVGVKPAGRRGRELEAAAASSGQLELS